MQCQFYRHFIALFWEFHLNIFRLHFPGSHNWAFSFSSALLSFWRPCGTEKNHTRLWWAHSLQTWKNIYWHFILSARCWLATMSRCLLHVVNLLVVLYLRWWCGLWKLVCCRCSSSTASAMLPTSSTASASRNLDPPKQNHPPSESSSLWHILGGAEHFNQIFKRMFGNISDRL